LITAFGAASLSTEPVVVSPRTHMLYMSYGSDRGPGAVGRLLAYDLVRGTVVFTRSISAWH
jgi:hypothetical protein